MNLTKSVQELASKEFWLCVASEFFGCFFFLFIAAGSAVSLDQQNPPSVLHIALTTGLTISTLVMATLHKSGGHLNPAVSFAFLVARKISVLRGLLYIVAQALGAIAGSSVLYGVVPGDKRGTLGTPVRGSTVTTEGAFGCELVLTFLLVFVIFACTDAKRNHYGYEVALSIGVCVAVTNAMGIPISGGAVNPARAFGPAVVSNVWIDHWIYWVGPCLGGVLAALSYSLVFRETEDRKQTKNDVTLEVYPTVTKDVEAAVKPSVVQ